MDSKPRCSLKDWTVRLTNVNSSSKRLGVPAGRTISPSIENNNAISLAVVRPLLPKQRNDLIRSRTSSVWWSSCVSSTASRNKRPRSIQSASLPNACKLPLKKPKNRSPHRKTSWILNSLKTLILPVANAVILIVCVVNWFSSNLFSLRRNWTPRAIMPTSFDAACADSFSDSTQGPDSGSLLRWSQSASLSPTLHLETVKYSCKKNQKKSYRKSNNLLTPKRVQSSSSPPIRARRKSCKTLPVNSGSFVNVNEAKFWNTSVRANFSDKPVR